MFYQGYISVPIVETIKAKILAYKTLKDRDMIKDALKHPEKYLK